MGTQDIKATVKAYIMKEFLPGEDPEALDDTTELITQGVLDSLATLKLVSFLEEQFGIALAPHETDAEHLNTLADIAELVGSKT
ncbi:MAG: acyl carrier protein [Gammaproteobacteria bacterium]